MEKMGEKQELAFVDMAVYVDEQKKSLVSDSNTHQTQQELWISKAAHPSSIGKTVVEGTLPRLFRSTSNWQYFWEALKSDKIVSDIISLLIRQLEKF